MIETERLVLRNWKSGDVELFHRHCNTEPVMRWLGGVQPFSRMEEVVERLTAWQHDHGHTFWVAERREDGEFLGFCGIKLANGYNSTVLGEKEVGWRFREDVWGKGYAKEGAIASLDFAFERLRAERVVALTVEQNANSWGLMRRLGMQRREDLDYVDPEWPATMNPVIVYESWRHTWRR